MLQTVVGYLSLLAYLNYGFDITNVHPELSRDSPRTCFSVRRLFQALILISFQTWVSSDSATASDPIVDV